MNNFIRKVPKNRVVKNTDSILSVLKLMDATLRKLYIVSDNRDNYVGLVSMGDIQRAIIRNVALNESIGTILRKENKVANLNDPFSKIKELMIEFRMEFMPILNDEKQLVGLYLWEDLFPGTVKAAKLSINLPVVIMAGGQGSRLKPLTNILPKPLIPIGEKTIIETIMNSFMDFNCQNFYISLNYKADFTQDYIEKYINEDNKFKTHFFIETKPLGTAGSLYLLKGKINSTFFISNCDILIEQDYAEILNYHLENKNELTIVAALRHYRIPYGTIESGESGELQQLNEKPELTFKINSGLYILEPHLLNEIPSNEFFHITELIEKIKIRKGKVGVFPVPEGAWKDIGEWEEYLKHFKQ